jgi:peptidoglycan/xylan/chitin deacetylase (PgdA/CDA1 family)
MVISFTVDVEEWYHGLWLGSDDVVREYYNNKVPKGTFIEPLQQILKIFEKHRVRSTFFVLGETAEFSPEVIKEIYDLGHEIASHSYLHRDITKISLTELERSEKENKRLLKKITGESPKGFRAPLFKINEDIINSLEDMGYIYDSSVVPSLKIPKWFGYINAPIYPYHPDRYKLTQLSSHRNFYEVPLAVFPWIRLPAGGGWFLRNFGVRYVEVAIKYLLRKAIPIILYIHPLDVYYDVPKLKGIPFHVTRRCGGYTLKAIEHILRRFSCKKICICEMLKGF